MSDESDETRSVPPAGDDTVPQKRLDDTLADDATQVSPSSSTPSPSSPSPSSSSSEEDWSVWAGRASVRAPRPGQSIYDTDWSDGPVPPVTGERDRWWLPIVVGIIVLVLLGVLAWAIYLIVQNSGDNPSPVPTTPPTAVVTTNPPSPAPSAAATTSTAPSSEPTTVPTTTATTQEPTAAVTVPALRGLPLAEARAALNRTGLRYRVLYLNSTAAPGTVIDSDPAEGQEVPPDTRVTIVVAQEGAATTTPTATVTTTAGG
ncbi:PASTA domain-containing protein [Paractinoplanes globisporus]|uniref:PASTA domain-containing protein n=1 Tax=Paractinoplanes globisporus TaxID=113565 RepID=A0ABW6WP65_9ACTN|nr:PASTA domain-containing protein [Actinoplanes globisporus]